MQYLDDTFVNSLAELLYKYTTEKQRIEIIEEFEPTKLEVEDIESMIEQRIENYSSERSKHSVICKTLLKDLLGQIREHHLYKDN